MFCFSTMSPRVKYKSDYGKYTDLMRKFINEGHDIFLFTRMGEEQIIY